MLLSLKVMTIRPNPKGVLHLTDHYRTFEGVLRNWTTHLYGARQGQHI